MARSFPAALVGQFARSLVRPARRNVPVRPLRAFVGLPVIFDLVSLAMQVADIGRTRRIRGSYSTEHTHHRAVQDYNAEVTLAKMFTTTRRMDIYYKLLALPPRDIGGQRLLIVGPRNRHELLAAWVHGFRWAQIEAIDLYSTHPKIRVMNMEAMTWTDASFDAVAMANTLSYADSTLQALSEVARILKPGGRFAFSATYDPDGSPWKEDNVPFADVVAMLHGLGLEIVVHDAEDKINSGGRRQTSHHALARKIPPGEQRRDPFRL